MANRAHRTTGQHKPKTIPSSHHKHYWPYIPVLLMVIAVFAVNLLQPLIERTVLSYATEMSVSQLLAATNEQRTKNGVAPLTMNNKLVSAAQSKANDMVARNYWAHNTPDGKEPWVFFDAAGYDYYKAGENLAYGFSTSNAAVAGWMNSASHRENLLDSAFTEVGFGFANGENYNNSGQETVVVAEYGRPQVLAQSNSSPAPDQTAPVQKPAPVAQAAPEANTQPAESATEKTSGGIVVNTDTKVPTETKAVPISRIQSLSGDNTWLVFATGLLTGMAAAILLVKHALLLRHLIRDTERFILRHPVLDTVLVGIILVGSFMMQTNGFLK